jgi:RHS repeat-associated protein
MPVTKYIWDDQNYLAEADDADTTNVVYTNEPEQFGELVSSRLSATTSFHHFDGVGSTRQLTSAGAAVTDTWIYDAWGNLVSRTGSTGVSLLWIAVVGYYYDSEIAQLTIRARPYDPPIARWTATDPSQPSDSPNGYSYATNAPLNRTDPSGLLSAPDPLAPSLPSRPTPVVVPVALLATKQCMYAVTKFVRPRPGTKCPIPPPPMAPGKDTLVCVKPCTFRVNCPGNVTTDFRDAKGVVICTIQAKLVACCACPRGAFPI